MNCKHIFNTECVSCNEDGSYNWITCSEYKQDKCQFSCSQCGEIINESKEKETINV